MPRADPHRGRVTATFGAAVRRLGPDELPDTPGEDQRVIEDAIVLADRYRVLLGPSIEAGDRPLAALAGLG